MAAFLYRSPETIWCTDDWIIYALLVIDEIAEYL